MSSKRTPQEVPEFSIGDNRSWLLSVVIPIALIALILVADILESPKTAYVGVLSAVPLFAAIFGTPRSTAAIAVITWVSAFEFGQFAEDGSAPAQTVRLVIIAISGVVAVLAAVLRQRRDVQLRAAMASAAGAAVMHRQATHDDLTGLLNRRGFYEQCGARTAPTPLMIALLDCDDFKQVNDEFGHLIGDEFLQGAAGRIAGSVAASDLVARWGGDEFLIALDLPPDQARAVFDRVLASVSQAPITTSSGQLPLTLSAGVTQWQPGESLDQALAAADRALYLAKQAGGGVTRVG